MWKIQITCQKVPELNGLQVLEQNTCLDNKREVDNQVAVCVGHIATIEPGWLSFIHLSLTDNVNRISMTRFDFSWLACVEVYINNVGISGEGLITRESLVV